MSEPSRVELDRMSAVQAESNAIGRFMDWLEDVKGYSLAQIHTHDDECLQRDAGNFPYYVCGYLNHGLMPVFGATKEQLLADFFEIDLAKIEDERSALIEHLQKLAEA